ncbi:MAG: hypothetical protein MJY90_07235 [Bacteroidaceae bacterium]|nr:hypothetical protein [Bacteroidaceae bacterium]
MKVIQNKIIPFGKNFLAINLFGVIFAKGHLNARVHNHEFIHTLQQREMLFVVFYLWYLVEWLVRIVMYRDVVEAYRNISFEREAYANDHDFDYPHGRKLYGWTNYLVEKQTK